MATTLDVNVVTPKGVIAHEDTDALTAPGEEGEFELLPGHTPLLAALKPGVLTIGEKTRTTYAVSSGYLRIDPAEKRGRGPGRAGGPRRRGRPRGGPGRPQGQRGRARQVGRQAHRRRLEEPGQQGGVGPGPRRRRRAPLTGARR
ncbi:MAG: hypothetical protein R3B06_14750 [Kofleriaceae bacterium]